ncbi:CRE-FAT-3 protein [Caenorhabditis remanei]|uniref:CRE-FAT-3 protein n=1 Tax=Caenorhabditis remanei TaxID=31234 RepID=E3MLW4_CAERE|nr:CRE-FAT-3 protein [Caenorhabditis remanei]
MVVNRDASGLHMKLDQRWLYLSEEFLKKHPGGAVIEQYRNADATHIFHAFHEGSSQAYKQLDLLKKHSETNEELDKLIESRVDKTDINVSTYDISIEQEKKMVESFEKLRQRLHDDGLMEANESYFVFKSVTTLSIMFFAFYLQYLGFYITSACVLALAWQQFGWLTHEFCHQQPTKNRPLNDTISLFFGNFLQGFSRDWWKDKHNTHHAATNIIDHDGDIDLAPLFAFIPSDLCKYKASVEKAILKIIPYQHLYFTAMLPMLRFSWTSQSVQWVFRENQMEYKVYQRNAFWEQATIVGHWAWVFYQLFLLPSWPIRVAYFLISQLGGGLLIAHVVTFNHNSVDKYPANSRIMNNFAALQILTTRNMTPSPFIDWLWGGLNYQIEHHLFPTMPRCNLNTCMKYVKEWCRENNLPYLVDDYFVGYAMNLKQLQNMAEHVQAKAA